MRVAIVGVLLLVPVTACGGSSKPSTAPLTNNGATVATFSGKDSGAFCPIAGPFVHATDLQAVFTDAAAAQARVTELRPVIAEARRKAPPEIKADVQRVADRITQGFDALAAANYQVLKVDRATIDGLLADEQFKTSATRVGEYASQVCKVGP
jgi:hypothetical protein